MGEQELLSILIAPASALVGALGSQIISYYLEDARSRRKMEKLRDENARQFVKNQFDAFREFLGACSSLVSIEHVIRTYDKGAYNYDEAIQKWFDEIKSFREIAFSLKRSGRTFLLPRIDKLLSDLIFKAHMSEVANQLFYNKEIMKSQDKLQLLIQYIELIGPDVEYLKKEFQRLLDLERLNAE